EKRKIIGPCSNGGGGLGFASSHDDEAEAEEPVSQPSAGRNNIAVKTVEPQKLYYAVYTMAPDEMNDKVVQAAVKMGINIVKSGGKIAGPMPFIFDEIPAENARELTFKLAFPVSGRPSSAGQYRLKRDKDFKCAYRLFEGKQEDMQGFSRQFFEEVIAAGYELSGEIRQVTDKDATLGQTTLKMELQIGIK
ncbi:MAG: hypothetical protein KDI30_07495, partial [Pseudomonadales bacterium]|nr:hypothetical protein [Pseudomonadales bacterium]